MMHRLAVSAAAVRLLSGALALFLGLGSIPAHAQDDFELEEPSFSVNGMLRMQGGVFVPLASSKFEPHENVGVRGRSQGGGPCDQREGTIACLPQDHGQKPGTPSIARMTLQLEAQWDINEHIGLHTIVRAVRSLRLPADRYARVPQQNLEAWRRKDYDELGRSAEDWVYENQYNELDLREFYFDLIPNNWLSMRIGRQQIMWGDVGGYRLLDAVNPENTTWHWGTLEATEDTRIPLWMWLTTFDIPSIEHSLELLWVPMIDRPKDTVTTPLTFSGAWGVPYPDVPTAFYSPNLNFKYPGGRFRDMRAGARWKGNLGSSTNYSLVYLYTHQFAPAIPSYGYYGTNEVFMADPDTGRVTRSEVPDATVTREIVLVFPRQHIAGFSVEHAFTGLGTVARVEAAFEPNRTFSGKTNNPTIARNDPTKLIFQNEEMMAVNYAVVLQRPTMIRFLNPSSNFLLVAQFFHSFIPELDMDSAEGKLLTHVPGYNGWQLQKHSYRVVGLARTSYLNGRISLGLMGVYMPNPYAEDSGFYSIDVGFRMGPHYRLNIVATDFVGKDPYRDLGLYRDRDEVAANLTLLF